MEPYKEQAQRNAPEMRSCADSMKEPVSATLRRAFQGRRAGKCDNPVEGKEPPDHGRMRFFNRAAISREMKKAVDGFFVAKLFSRRMLWPISKATAGNSGGVPLARERPPG